MSLPAELLGYEATSPRRTLWAEPGPRAHDPSLYRKAAALLARRILAEPPAPGGSPDLYAGPAGVAVFLAAHGRLNGERDCEARAREILEGIHRAALSPADPPAGWHSGGLTGLGSLVYACTLAARILDDPSWLDRALDLAARLDRSALAGDRCSDVAHGAAGTLLAILALRSLLPQERPERETLLDLARQCGGQLRRSWNAAALSNGFAHGASGVALALCRLAAAAGDGELLAAAFKGLEDERSLFVPEAGNWAISPGDPRRPVGWCYGAAGIALARIGLLRSLPPGLEADLAEPLRRDLRHALLSSWTAPTTPFDHLCCGTLSRAEAFLASWDFSRDPEDLRAAGTIAALVLRLAKTRGHFATGDGGSAETSFFQGLSGIGYTFLRLAEPGRLPSVLLFE